MAATPMPFKADTVYLYRGDSWTFPTYQFMQSDGVTPMNLSGYTWSAQWRPTVDSETFVPISLDLTNAATGVIIPSVSATNSALLGQTGVWDLQSTLGGVVKTWAYGTVYAAADVTRG